MTAKEIKFILNSIKDLNLSNKQKKRMINFLQVRGINKKNKVMSYNKLKSHISNKKGNITKIVLGPNWNRLVFIDIDIEV